MKKEYLIIVLILVYFLYIKEPSLVYVTEECEQGDIFVEIKGEVVRQGVYEIESGTRLVHVVELAGGLTSNADVLSINMSQKLKDEDVIIVESIEEKSHNFININKANLSELMMLPSLGEKKAQAIIDYRENVGRFDQIKDIMNVTGIGESIFASIKELISTK